MKRLFLLSGLLFMNMFLFACASKNIPPEKSVSPESQVQAVQPITEESWKKEWNDILLQARKEGKVTVSTMIEPGARGILEGEMKKFGLDIEWRAGLSPEVATKVLSERKAGIFNLDVWTGGANTMVSRLKPADVFDPIIPALILPEIKENSAWWEGTLPFVDKDRLLFSYAAYPQKPLMINTEMVKKEELVSHYDLLLPKWEGKIIMGDPTMPGSMAKWFSTMVEKDLGPILGLDYMKGLAKQKPVIIRDRRLAAEWIVRGKYPIGLNLMASTVVREMEKQGVKLPTTEVNLKEGAYVTSGYSILALVNKAPHPDAARVFINWLLSREGQITYSKAVGFHSTRIDIPEPQQISPDMERREPGIKYINSEQEEYLLKTSEYLNLSKEIFGSLLGR